MKKRILLSVLISFSLLGTVSCANDTPQQPTDTSTGTGDTSNQPSENTYSDPSHDPSDNSEIPVTTMPEGTHPASSEFPIPVPDDWEEVLPFREEKLGGDIGYSATYRYPGEAKSAANSYQSLLKQAGYEVHDNPLGAQVHDASFIVKGLVNDVAYIGSINFNITADGKPHAVFSLSVD